MATRRRVLSVVSAIAAVADGPVLETGDAVRHTADLVGSVSQAAATRTGAPKLPYLCAGSVDYPPHASRTAAYTINVHFDTKCRMTAPNVSTEGSLSRSRWYGWEQLEDGQGQQGEHPGPARGGPQEL